MAERAPRVMLPSNRFRALEGRSVGRQHPPDPMQQHEDEGGQVAGEEPGPEEGQGTHGLGELPVREPGGEPVREPQEPAEASGEGRRVLGRGEQGLDHHAGVLGVIAPESSSQDEPVPQRSPTEEPQRPPPGESLAWQSECVSHRGPQERARDGIPSHSALLAQAHVTGRCQPWGHEGWYPAGP